METERGISRACLAAGLAVVLGALAANAGITEIIDAAGDGAGNVLDEARDLVVDASGNVFVAGSGSDNVFKITPSGTITEIIDGTGDGAGNVLDIPNRLAVGVGGDVFVKGSASGNVFRITAGGAVTEIIDGSGDGAGNPLSDIEALRVDAAGNVFVTGGASFGGSNNVFKVTPAGTITEILDATGDGAGNVLDDPLALAVDDAGNAFVTGWVSDNVFKITPGGTVTEIIDATGDGAGNPLNGPASLTVDGAGNVLVAGVFTDNVFRITPAGTITEIIDATGDGAGNTVSRPGAIVVDLAGNVFVANIGGFGPNNVFKITPGGVITTIIDVTGDGIGNVLAAPRSLAVDTAGNVFVLSSVGDQVFKITPGGSRTEIIDGEGDGAGNPFMSRSTLAVDGAGNVFVSGIKDPSESGNAFEVSLENGCPAVPQAGCATAEKGRLVIVRSPSHAKDRITWKWGPGSVAPGDFGDPLTAHDYRLCVYDGTDGLVSSALMAAGGTCGSAPCWKGTGSPPGSAGFRYKNKSKIPDGISKLVLRSRGKLRLSGKGHQLVMPGLPRSTPVDLLVQLQAGNGECWETSYGGVGVLQNTATKFKARASPSGAFLD